MVVTKPSPLGKHHPCCSITIFNNNKKQLLKRHNTVDMELYIYNSFQLLHHMLYTLWLTQPLSNIYFLAPTIFCLFVQSNLGFVPFPWSVACLQYPTLLSLCSFFLQRTILGSLFLGTPQCASYSN